MDRLLNAIKAHSGAQDAAAGHPRFGTVTSVDPAAATAHLARLGEAAVPIGRVEPGAGVRVSGPAV